MKFGVAFKGLQLYYVCCFFTHCPSHPVALYQRTSGLLGTKNVASVKLDSSWILGGDAATHQTTSLFHRNHYKGCILGLVVPTWTASASPLPW